MENFDWLSRIAPWLANHFSSANGAGAPGGGMFGSGGWPFFGNAGQSPGGPTGGAPGGRTSFLGLDPTAGGGRPFVNPGASPPQGGSMGGGRPFANPGFTPPQSGTPMMRGFAEGGRPEPGAPAMVGEQGPEVFVPDEPGTVIPNHAIPQWLQDALIQMPPPEPQPRAAPPQMQRQAQPMHKRASERPGMTYQDVRDIVESLKYTGAPGMMVSNVVGSGMDTAAGIKEDPTRVFDLGGVTGQIIGAALRNASPNRAQAAPAGGKKAAAQQRQATGPITDIMSDEELKKAPKEAVMREQRFLAAQGFYNPANIDGDPGDLTVAARGRYRAAQAAQVEKDRAAQAEERRLAIEEGKLEQGKTQAAATIKTAEVRDKELDLQAENDRLARERKAAGEERLREAEKNAPFWSKFMREYAPTIGGVAGTIAGPAARSTVKKLGDMYQTSRAAKAEATLGNPTGPVTVENLSERVGKVNDWWRRGGAKNEPFVTTPMKNPGVAVNVDKTGMPIATPISDLFQHGIVAPKIADAGALGGIGGVGYLINDMEGAQEAFAAAKTAVDQDPSDVNIEEYMKARSRLSSAEAKRNATLAALGMYVGTAVSKQRHPIVPPTNAADQSKIDIEKFIREYGTNAEKTAKAAAARQATAARKAAEKEAAAANPSLQDLTGAAPAIPSNPLRKFDNQGNPINRPPASLEEMTAPRQAVVPKRTRKKAASE